MGFLSMSMRGALLKYGYTTHVIDLVEACESRLAHRYALWLLQQPPVLVRRINLLERMTRNA